MHVGELGVAAVSRNLSRQQQRTARWDIFEGIVCMPQPIGVRVHPPFVIRWQDAAVVANVRNVGHLMVDTAFFRPPVVVRRGNNRSETFAEGDMLLVAQKLVSEQQDSVRVEAIIDRLPILLRQWFPEINASHFCEE